MTSNRWFKIFLIFMSGCMPACASNTDVLTSFNDNTLPVLNENLRSLNDNANKSKNILNERFDANGALLTTYGGTSSNLSAATADSVVYMSSNGVMGTIPSGAAGYLLQSHGAGVSPSFENVNTFKFISKTSLSANTSSGAIAIDSSKYYFVTVNITTLSAADSLSLRFNGDSGNNYGWVYRGFDVAATAGNGNGNGVSLIQMGNTYITTNYSAYYSFYIYPESAGNYSMISGRAWGRINGTNFGYNDFFGYWTNAVATTSFSIISTGGANMTGDINVYQIQQQ